MFILNPHHTELLLTSFWKICQTDSNCVRTEQRFTVSSDELHGWARMGLDGKGAPERRACSHLIRFARVSSHVVDFNARNKSLTTKLLQQGYRYHKLRKTFSKFFRRHYELVSKFSVGLKTLLHQGLSEPEFYGDLVYKFKQIVGRADFSDQFRKIIVRNKTYWI